ncbi:hypothetical protein ONZ45_g4494 [Pleurotus djamor]|nr:hypothetical protein ONZ45_g4494 [Pleurotus djamor]
MASFTQSNNYSSNAFGDSEMSKPMNGTGFEDTNRDLSGSRTDSGFKQGQNFGANAIAFNDSERQNALDHSTSNGGLGMAGGYETTTIGGGEAGIDANSKEHYGQRAGQIDAGSMEAHGVRSGGIDAGSKEAYGRNSSNIDHGSLEASGQRTGGIDVNSNRGDGTGFDNTQSTGNDDASTFLSTLNGQPSPATTSGQASQYSNAGSAQGGGYGGGYGDNNQLNTNEASTNLSSSNDRDYDRKQQPQQFTSHGSSNHGDRGERDAVGSDAGTKGGASFGSTPHREDHNGTVQHHEFTKSPTADAPRRTGHSFGDKMKGKVEEVAGKVVGNETMIERGRERQDLKVTL